MIKKKEMVETGIKRRIEEPTIGVQAATWGNVLKMEGIRHFEKEFWWGSGARSSRRRD